MQKFSTINFWLGSGFYSSQQCNKKKSFKRYFPSSVKLFVFILIMHILFFANRKYVTERNRLDLWSLFIVWGSQFLILPDWIIKNGLCQILCLVLEFLIKRRGFGLFIAACLAQIRKNNCNLFKDSKKEQAWSILTCPKLAKWISTLNCSKSGKWPVWKPIYLKSGRS